jgi:hypothetical protein
MAEQDRKQWQELLKKHCNYQSTALLRKQKGYGRKLALWEAIEIATEMDLAFSITTIFPFGDSNDLKDGVTLFPQTIRFEKNHLYELEEPVLYAGEFLTLDNFVVQCPRLEIATIPMVESFACSLAVFLMTTKQHNKFRKLYMLPVRKRVTRACFVLETRGKNRYVPEWKKEMRGFVRRFYKESGKKAIPVREIKDAWRNYADTKLANKQGVMNFISESTIRRILRAVIKT